MIKTKGQNPETWRQIIDEATRHPEGITAYCRATGVSKANIYYWRRKLHARPAVRSLKPVNPFVRVEVIDPMPKLPDAKWVADVLRHLVGSGK